MQCDAFAGVATSKHFCRCSEFRVLMYFESSLPHPRDDTIGAVIASGEHKVAVVTALQNDHFKRLPLANRSNSWGNSSRDKGKDTCTTRGI